MDLYIVYQFGTENVLGAYWGDSLSAVMDAYKTDGINPDDASSLGATTAQAAMYHGPDFDGRKAWLVFDDSVAMMRYINSLGADTSGLLYGIAADNYQAAIDFDPAPFREKRVCITGLRSEADAHLAPGWDQ